MKPKPVRLLHSAPPLDQLLGRLDARADLPAETWKRLYIVALRRLGKRQSTLATLCAVEAESLASSASVLSSQGDSAVETGLEEKLLLIERRPMGRGHIRGLNPDPAFLHALFRMVRRLLEECPLSLGNAPARRAEAWAAMWKSWGNSDKPPVIPDQGNPVDAALALIARLYQYTPESLRVVFRREKLPLGKDVW